LWEKTKSTTDYPKMKQEEKKNKRMEPIAEGWVRGTWSTSPKCGSPAVVGAGGRKKNRTGLAEFNSDHGQTTENRVRT